MLSRASNTLHNLIFPLHFELEPDEITQTSHPLHVPLERHQRQQYLILLRPQTNHHDHEAASYSLVKRRQLTHLVKTSIQGLLHDTELAHSLRLLQHESETLARLANDDLSVAFASRC